MYFNDRPVPIILLKLPVNNALEQYSKYCILIMSTLSLGALVPNSRDRHEKQWRPDFTHHKTHPKIRFVCKKQTEVHF